MTKEEHYEILSAINTLRAGWLELKLAKWFGSPVSCIDTNGMLVTQTRYRGRLYLLDFKDIRGTSPK